MMEMIKRAFLVFSVVVMLAGTAWAEPVVLKFACFEPPKSFALTKVFMPWVEQVNKEGKGFLKIDVYPGGVLGRSPLKQLELVRNGVADIAWILPSYTPGLFEDDEVVEVPFLAKNALEASVSIWRMFEKGMLSGYDNIHPLMLGAAQPYAVHSTFPVKVPGDMKDKKIRAVGKMQYYFADAYGAIPVGRIPVPQIAEAMSRGVIQATLNEWNGIRTFRIDDVAYYHCMVPLGTITFLVAMNKEKYESLSPEAKAVLDKYSGEPFVRSWGGEQDKDLAKYAKKIVHDPKHHVYTATGPVLEEWKTTLAPAVEKWIKDRPKGATLIKAYKEEIAKVRAEK